MVAQVGYSVTGRSRGRVAPCTVCTWHLETRSTGFLVEPQNQGRRFCEWFGLKTTQTVCEWFDLKTTRTVFSSLTSKLVTTVSSGLASKPVVGFLVEPQNQGGGGSPGLGLKTGSSGLEIWASKSMRQFLGLGLKIKQASVCQLCHKLNGGRSAWDTRRYLAAYFA
jgi:hypothetical protein